jgi:hypothetical protein
MAHAPKVNALEAYVEGRLSAPAQARLLAHVRDCAVCERRLASIKQYRSLREEAKQEPSATLSWERLEQALERESRAQPARERPSSGRIVALAWPVMALAATFVLGWFALSQQAELARTPPRALPPEEQRAEQPRREGWVTLAAAHAELVDGAETRVARPGLVVREGMLLRTGPASELHVALGDGSALVVESDSEVRVARLRGEESRLELLRGSLFSGVKKLPRAERYEVAFGTHVAQVRGTRFRVERRADEAVAVFEGRVVVLAGETLVADLAAGQRWPATSKRGSDREIRGADPASRAWPTLALPSVPGVAAWEFGASQLPASGLLAMRVPPGRHELHFSDLRGKRHVLAVDVAQEGATLDEASIQRLLAQQNEASGELSPEAIEPVVRGGLDVLRRCYEHSLRRDPSLTGKLLLAIRVAPDGHVARASLRVDGAELPIDLERCIETEARGWKFPQPRGGSVEFEVPLNLKAGR